MFDYAASDRTTVLDNFFDNEATMIAARRKFEEKLAKHKAGTLKTKRSMCLRSS